jgi:hypothetical protein
VLAGRNHVVGVRLAIALEPAYVVGVRRTYAHRMARPVKIATPMMYRLRLVMPGLFMAGA